MSTNLFAKMAAGVVVLLVAGSGFLVLRLANGYQVSGVPFFGFDRSLHADELYKDLRGFYRTSANGSAASSLLMVAGYWRYQDKEVPLLVPRQAREKLSIDRPNSLTDIAVAAKQLGYEARIDSAPFGVWSLGDGESRRVPVIVEQNVSTAYPGEGPIFRVVLGTARFGRGVFVHDYVTGAFQTMSAGNFNKLWRKPRRMLVIEPTRPIQLAMSAPFVYESTGVEPALRSLYERWYLGEVTRFTGGDFTRSEERKQAAKHYDAVLQDPAFASLPATHRLYILIGATFVYFGLERWNDVVSLEQTALAIIDQVGEKDFFGQVAGYHKAIVLTSIGEGFLGVGNAEKAKEYAQRAIAARPGYDGGHRLLQEIEEHTHE